MRHDGDRFALRLEVTVRHGHGRLFVAAGNQLRALVAAVVDQRLVKAAEARSRVGEEVLEAQRLEESTIYRSPRARVAEHLHAAGRRSIGASRRGRLSRGGPRCCLASARATAGTDQRAPASAPFAEIVGVRDAVAWHAKTINHTTATRRSPQGTKTTHTETKSRRPSEDRDLECQHAIPASRSFGPTRSNSVTFAHNASQLDHHRSPDALYVVIERPACGCVTERSRCTAGRRRRSVPARQGRRDPQDAGSVLSARRAATRAAEAKQRAAAPGNAPICSGDARDRSIREVQAATDQGFVSALPGRSGETRRPIGLDRRGRPGSRPARWRITQESARSARSPA